MSGTNRLVLHIGVAFLFKSGHIVVSKYVVQSSTNEGLEKLKKAVQEIPLTREIVLLWVLPMEGLPQHPPRI
jgi:hypothetical protein